MRAKGKLPDDLSFHQVSVVYLLSYYSSLIVLIENFVSVLRHVGIETFISCMNTHMYLCAADTSDHYLLNTSLLIHGVTGFTDPQLSMIASLDHAIVSIFWIQSNCDLIRFFLVVVVPCAI
jgi:acyl-CoA thioesterase